MKKEKIRKRKKTDLFDVINTLFLTILMVIVLLPFYFTVVRSFMTQQDFMMNGASLWPEHFTLGNYRDIFVGSNMLRSFGNSVLYTVTGVAFSMFLTTTMAYGLSKKNYPGRALIQNMVIFTMYFGGGLIPFFLLIKDLGMMNTRWAVIIPLSFNVFNLIILRRSEEHTSASAGYGGVRDTGRGESVTGFLVHQSASGKTGSGNPCAVLCGGALERVVPFQSFSGKRAALADAVGTEADTLVLRFLCGKHTGGSGKAFLFRGTQSRGSDGYHASHHVRLPVSSEIFCKGSYDWSN